MFWLDKWTSAQFLADFAFFMGRMFQGFEMFSLIFTVIYIGECVGWYLLGMIFDIQVWGQEIAGWMKMKMEIFGFDLGDQLKWV